jgi:hypothetical protein
MDMSRRMRGGIAVVLAAGLVGFAVPGSGAGRDLASPPPPPLVTVARHGGLCVSGRECRFVFRIGDSMITAPGYVPRRLASSERRTLVRAIAALDLAAIRQHPFHGTCPISYDGQESVYRFRGFSTPLASCTFDLERVPAVRLAARLIATLHPLRTTR